jgi:hypothetical protein
LEILFALGGLSLTLIISWFDHFNSVVATDCPNVIDFVPSISACIGDFAPQRYIWRLAVAFFVPLRILDGFMIHYKFKNEISCYPSKNFNIANLFNVNVQSLLKFKLFCHCLEYLSLYLLTYVSSSDYLLFHILGFSCFIVFSLLYSTCTIYVSAILKRHSNSFLLFYSWKKKFYFLNVCFAVGAVIAWTISKNVCVSGSNAFKFE